MNTQIPTTTYMPPETETQRYLAGIIEETLKVEQICLDADFFELGGDSLLALQVYDKVRKHYKREFPLFDLSESPTIRNLAKMVDAELQGVAEDDYRCLRRVQKGDVEAVPLFLVHGGDGNARVFQRLANHLDPRIPVYAFRWSGWDGRRGDRGLRGMAKAYKEELLRYRPVGPYRIGGYCIGGLVAIELARMLVEEGCEIDQPVFIWDAPNVESASYRRREPWYSAEDYVVFKRLLERLNELKRETKTECEPLSVPTEFSGSYELLRRFPRLYTVARALQIILANIPIQLRLLTNRPVPIRQRWVYGMSTCYFALRRHFSIKYSGSVTYFRSDVFLGRTMNMLGWWDDPFMGFGEMCEGEFKGYVIGGTHVDVLSEPAGARIVNQAYFDSE